MFIYLWVHQVRNVESRGLLLLAELLLEHCLLLWVILLLPLLRAHTGLLWTHSRLLQRKKKIEMSQNMQPFNTCCCITL